MSDDSSDNYQGDRMGKVWAASWERVEDYREAQKILDRVFPLGEEEKRMALANLCLAYAIEKGVRPSELELVTYSDPDALEVGYRFRVRRGPPEKDDDSPADPVEDSLGDH